MVKYTLSIFITFLLAALVLASNTRDIETRAVSENNLFGRELSEAEATLYSRDIQELFARLPASGAFSKDDTHELVTRRVSASVKRGWHNFTNGIKNVGKTILGAFIRREDAWKPGHLGVNREQALNKLVASRSHDELHERDLEDLYQREVIGWEIDELD